MRIWIQAWTWGLWLLMLVGFAVFMRDSESPTKDIEPWMLESMRSTAEQFFLAGMILVTLLLISQEIYFTRIRRERALREEDEE